MRCQPMALKYIIESKYATKEYLNKESRSTRYKLIHVLNSICDNCFEDINGLKEHFKELPLTNTINERIIDENNTNTNTCSICLTYKHKIFFVPCGHIVCVGCGFRLKQCPYCSNGQKKEVKLLF